MHLLAPLLTMNAVIPRMLSEGGGRYLDIDSNLEAMVVEATRKI